MYFEAISYNSQDKRLKFHFKRLSTQIKLNGVLLKTLLEHYYSVHHLQNWICLV